MADVKNAAPDVEYNDDGTKNPDFVPPKIEDEKKPTDADTTIAGDDKDKDGTTDTTEPEFDDTIAPVIPIRKSVAEHIIARKNEKIKKLESKAEKKDEGASDADDEEDDSNLTDDARGAISREVDRHIAPVVKMLVTEADAQELKDLFASEPEAKKYENHIKAYMQHEQYKGVPPAFIYHHLAFSASKALGAKQKKVADKEAELNKNGGRGLPPKGGAGDLPSAEDIAEMSDADFAKMEENVLQGKFIKK